MFDAKLLITLGGCLLLGLLADALGRRTPLPRVTLLILFGIFIGPSGLNVLAPPVLDLFPFMTQIALAMVGFIIGGKLYYPTLKEFGNLVLTISVIKVIVTLSVVALGLAMYCTDLRVALILGAIATATAPIPVLAVIEETGEKVFTDLLLSIVVFDDAWTLVVFSVVISVIQSWKHYGIETHFFITTLWELIRSMAMGIGLGIPMAYLSGRIKKNQMLLVEAIAFVLIACGIAAYFHLSYLMTCMVMGMVVTNLARHHEQPFCSIQNIEWPFLIIFFILAGASFELSILSLVGTLGILYVLLRTFGTYYGAYFGALIGRTDSQTRLWLGVAMLPQAGVEIGLALTASQLFPEVQYYVLPVVIIATVVFDTIGPLLTKVAIQRHH